MGKSAVSTTAKPPSPTPASATALSSSPSSSSAAAAAARTSTFARHPYSQQRIYSPPHPNPYPSSPKAHSSSSSSLSNSSRFGLNSHEYFRVEYNHGDSNSNNNNEKNNEKNNESSFYKNSPQYHYPTFDEENKRKNSGSTYTFGTRDYNHHRSTSIEEQKSIDNLYRNIDSQFPSGAAHPTRKDPNESFRNTSNPASQFQPRFAGRHPQQQHQQHQQQQYHHHNKSNNNNTMSYVQQPSQPTSNQQRPNPQAHGSQPSNPQQLFTGSYSGNPQMQRNPPLNLPLASSPPPPSQQQPSQQQNYQLPPRSRGDSIFLPPPITSQMRPSNEPAYETTSSNMLNQNANPLVSRSNSIFSSLINLPGSTGNSVSDQSSTYPNSGPAPAPSTNTAPATASGSAPSANNGAPPPAAGKNTSLASSAPTLPPNLPPPSRSRQMSLAVPNQEFTVEDLENLFGNDRESMANLFNWSQGDAKSSSAAGSKTKAGSLDLSSWVDGSQQPNSIAFTSSVTEIIQNMISNGSLDFSNMNNQERRNSILKIINDQNGIKNQRKSNPSTNSNVSATLRQDIFDKGRTDRHDGQSLQQSIKPQQLSPEQFRQGNPGGKPEKDHVSPTSSMSSKTSRPTEQSHSPKTTPTFADAGVNDIYSAEMYTRPTINPQSQRAFQNGANTMSPSSNPYQFSNYPSFNNSLGFANMQTPGGNRQNSFMGNYSYPMQMQMQPQQQPQPQSQPQQQPQPQPQSQSQSQSQSHSHPQQPQQQPQPHLHPHQRHSQQHPQQQPQQMFPQQIRTAMPPQSQQYSQMYFPSGMPPQAQQQYYTQAPPPLPQPPQQPQYPPVQQQSQVPTTSKPKKQHSRRSRKSRDSTSERDYGITDNPNLMPAQQFAKSEDGRPLLGATKIDQLMLVIQAREKGVTKSIDQGPDGSILAAPDSYMSGQGIDTEGGVLPRPVSLVGGVDKPHKPKNEAEEGTDEYSQPKRKKAKNQQCPYCLKFFTQSTHLEVHIRSHIGYKPFECSYCHKKFTQGGNLRTHLRLHTGEKPFTCDICNRSFNRKGNLEAHKLTHENVKPFECRLDGCDKSFTQLGNLKSHQNRFHLQSLNTLTHKLAELSGPAINQLPPDEKDLLIYFKDLYKNSNKGIRGRGKQQKLGGEGGGEEDDDGLDDTAPQ
ncbi:uncharacterized protein LODBEIA_P08510 [Lodderomyces beijingensis]|uniref:C2H2-type domain-containing protein n=1 Tax=Lodderomyces beijingensis TaxID=1775926 RepID=A0ABP0ZEP8_9ASCO